MIEYVSKLKSYAAVACLAVAALVSTPGAVLAQAPEIPTFGIDPAQTVEDFGQMISAVLLATIMVAFGLLVIVYLWRKAKKFLMGT